jgi:hypothetical protein
MINPFHAPEIAPSPANENRRPRERRPWTEQDVERLEQYYFLFGTSGRGRQRRYCRALHEIGSLLNRLPDEVKAQIFTLRVTGRLPERGQRPGVNPRKVRECAQLRRFYTPHTRAFEGDGFVVAAVPFEEPPLDVLRLIGQLGGKARVFCLAAIEGAPFDEAAREAGLDANEMNALLPQLREHFCEHLLV